MLGSMESTRARGEHMRLIYPAYFPRKCLINPLRKWLMMCNPATAVIEYSTATD